MATQSIIEIREHRDNIKNALRTFRASEFKDNYGNEQEYTAQGIRATVQSILTDVTALTKAPTKFIQESTYDERRQLADLLSEVDAHIKIGALAHLVSTIEKIKPILRNIGIRHSDERMEAFDEHINTLQKQASSLSQHITDVETIKSDATELQKEIASIHQHLTAVLESLESRNKSLTEKIDSTEEKRLELSGLLSEDKARSEEIEQILATANSQKAVIETFSKNVAKKGSQLEDQELATQQYKEKLEAFRGDHESYLLKAKELIKTAKLALEYKTAEGLSAAFTEQYNKANDIWPKRGWLIFSVIFVAVSIYIGFVLTTGETLGWGMIIGRLSLLPILIAGAWFCAGQYVKQRNIAEDYAYKAALAKSIVGFSDQLSTDGNKGEDYSYFMQRVLTQMLNDPLRRHSPKVAARSWLSGRDKGTDNDK